MKKMLIVGGAAAVFGATLLVNFEYFRAPKEKEPLWELAFLGDYKSAGIIGEHPYHGSLDMGPRSDNSYIRDWSYKEKGYSETFSGSLSPSGPTVGYSRTRQFERNGTEHFHDRISRDQDRGGHDHSAGASGHW